MKKAILLFLTALMTMGAMAQTDIQELQRKANAGDAAAQCQLGVCYQYGRGVTRSNEMAFKWYKKAAEQGNADAMVSLAGYYFSGNVVAQSDAEAFKWYKKAAEQGNAVAMYALGDCYAEGYGIAQSYAEAIKWYKKSVEQGDDCKDFCHLKMCFIAVHYYYGKGVTQSYEQAYNILKSMTEDDLSGGGMLLLARCYRFGRGGCPKDLKKANELEKKSAEKGDDEAMEAIRLEEQMAR